MKKTIWYWLSLRFLRGTRPTDQDRLPMFAPGTTMNYGGKHFLYMKAGKQLNAGDAVLGDRK